MRIVFRRESFPAEFSEALINAIWKGHRDLAVALIETGANPNSRVRCGMNSEFIRMMIESGAAPYLKEWRGGQPFLHFAKSGFADLIRPCMKKSALIRGNEKLRKDAMYHVI